MGNQGGYTNNIEGIPLPGDLPQVESSGAPNRDDSFTLKDPEGEPDGEHPERYFDVMADEVGAVDDPFVADKSAQKPGSAGIEDEENDFGLMSFSELDDDWTEGVLPESQPLHLVRNADIERDVETAVPDFDTWGVELQSDEIEGGP